MSNSVPAGSEVEFAIMPPKHARLVKGQSLGIVLSQGNTVVEEVRPNSTAEAQGVGVGMTLATVNNQPVDDAETFAVVVWSPPSS